MVKTMTLMLGLLISSAALAAPRGEGGQGRNEERGKMSMSSRERLEDKREHDRRFEERSRMRRGFGEKRGEGCDRRDNFGRHPRFFGHPGNRR